MSVDSRILNHLASFLLRKGDPHSVSTYDQALCKYGMDFADVWAAWRAIMDVRDETEKAWARKSKGIIYFTP